MIPRLASIHYREDLPDIDAAAAQECQLAVEEGGVVGIRDLPAPNEVCPSEAKWMWDKTACLGWS
jgi:hypothetical protein